MGLIEDHLRDKRLLWLQELESIRDQFEELAHNLQQEEWAPGALTFLLTYFFPPPQHFSHKVCGC